MERTCDGYDSEVEFSRHDKKTQWIIAVLFVIVSCVIISIFIYTTCNSDIWPAGRELCLL